MKRALAAALIASPLFALPAMADQRSSAAPDRPFGADTMTQVADARGAMDLAASSSSARDTTGKPAQNTGDTENGSEVDDTVTGGD